MAIEIERRFLVVNSSWRESAEAPRQFRQAYLALTGQASIRIRIVEKAEAYMTIKSAQAEIERLEFEYSIPVEDAETLMEMRSGNMIEKQRHIVSCGNARWEIDVFSGVLAGLVIAEIELPDRDMQFSRPDWLGAEITTDKRYSNASLAIHGLPQ
ncbi:MAG: CYTH domain-containing protein [Rhodomicrobiaceae bacterium]